MVGKMVVEDLDTEARQNFGTRKRVQAFLSGFQRAFARAFARADAKLHAGLGLKSGFKLICEAQYPGRPEFLKFEILGVEKKEEAENQSNPKPTDISSCAKAVVGNQNDPNCFIPIRVPSHLVT